MPSAFASRFGTKGREVYAVREIDPFTTVLDEEPIAYVRLEDTGDFPQMELARMLFRAFDVDKYEHTPVCSMPKCDESAIEDYYDAVCRNAYTMNDFIMYRKERLGFYQDLSLFNHSCDANCVLVFDETRAKVITIRKVHPGEELCTNYHLLASVGIPKGIRQSTLEREFDFQCLCNACLEETVENESERERSLFQTIEQSKNPMPLIRHIWKKEKSVSYSLKSFMCIHYVRTHLSRTDKAKKEEVALIGDMLQSMGNYNEGSYLEFYVSFLLSFVCGQVTSGHVDLLSLIHI